MKKKLPSLARTPSGLKKEVIAAVRTKGAGVTGEAVKRVIEGDDGGADDDGCDGEDDPELTGARNFLASVPSIEPAHVWWILENRDLEARQAAELGLDAERERLEAQAEQSGDDARAYLRERYIYGTFRDEVWDKRAEAWISTKALTNSEVHHMPYNPFTGAPCDPFDLLRRDPEAGRVHNERFLPGQEGEIVSVNGVAWLNTWTPPSVKPKKGTAKPMLDHILYLCNGDTGHAAHITDWLAYQVQNPGAKVNHAPLIISEHQGVGKDTLAEAMARVTGEDNVQFVQDDAVNEGRYHFMKRASLVVIPEVMCGDRRDIANKLKPLITQPVVEINEKNVKPYKVPNTANFVMFSNYTNAAYIEDHDRRYYVIICKDKPRSPSYYDALYEYIEGDGLAGFAWFLKNRDLSDFNPKAPAPHTEHKDTVRAATKAGWEAFLQDAWDSHAAPFDRDVVNLREALGVIGEMKGAPRVSTQQIAAFLKRDDIGGGDLGKPRIGPKGNQVRVYAVRELKKLQSAPADVLKLCFEGESLARATTIVKTQEVQADFARRNAEAKKADEQYVERGRKFVEEQLKAGKATAAE